jgi:hypothetical protein
MDNTLEILNQAVYLKKEATANLFTAYTIQTELEYDLALLKLEFRYDDEATWVLYEANLTILHQLLREVDADIVQLLQKIENYSFQISQI